MRLLIQILIVCGYKVSMWPIAEKFYIIWQEIQVGEPEWILSQLVFIDHCEWQSQLLPIFMRPAIKHFWVFFHYRTQNLMFVDKIQTEKHLHWNKEESLSVLDICWSTCPQKPSLKDGWIFEFRDTNTIIIAPFIEYFVLLFLIVFINLMNAVFCLHLHLLIDFQTTIFWIY